MHCNRLQALVEIVRTMERSQTPGASGSVVEAPIAPPLYAGQEDSPAMPLSEVEVLKQIVQERKQQCDALQQANPSPDSDRLTPAEIDALRALKQARNDLIQAMLREERV